MRLGEEIEQCRGSWGGKGRVEERERIKPKGINVNWRGRG